MDFIPRYAQPFTLAEAIKIDVAVITEEITRLQNSLRHLNQTQTTLQEYINEEPSNDVDSEIIKALEENKTVIGSQEERIFILKLALSDKGVHYGSHYDVNFGPPPAKTSRPSSNPSTTLPASTATTISPEDDVDGIHL
ncbi:hypothetical protein E4T56_gene12490 [Termitomyces sp. T112]|nr:hypothetical protein E4T56_gene12490 [Termitomyces sp. T112]